MTLKEQLSVLRTIEAITVAGKKATVGEIMRQLEFRVSRGKLLSVLIELSLDDYLVSVAFRWRPNVSAVAYVVAKTGKGLIGDNQS